MKQENQLKTTIEQFNRGLLGHLKNTKNNKQR